MGLGKPSKLVEKVVALGISVPKQSSVKQEVHWALANEQVTSLVSTNICQDKWGQKLFPFTDAKIKYNSKWIVCGFRKPKRIMTTPPFREGELL